MTFSDDRAVTPRVPFYRQRGYQILIGAIVGISIIGTFLDDAPATRSNGTAQPPRSAAPAAPEGPRLPSDQVAFIALIREYEDLYDGAETDLQRADVRVRRREALCDLISSGRVTGWVGEVDTIGGNSDGDAFVDLEIADGIHIGTWNNSLSDLFDDTLVPSSDPLYDTLLTLTEGTTVTFSGEFVESSDECLRTSNITEAFDMSRPDFKFRFSAIEPD